MSDTDKLILICDAIVQTVKESGPLGAPAGILYAALSSKGCTLENFEKIMAALVNTTLIRREGDCYRYVGV